MNLQAPLIYRVLRLEVHLLESLRPRNHWDDLDRTVCVFEKTSVSWKIHLRWIHPNYLKNICISQKVIVPFCRSVFLGHRYSEIWMQHAFFWWFFPWMRMKLGILVIPSIPLEFRIYLLVSSLFKCDNVFCQSRIVIMNFFPFSSFSENMPFEGKKNLYFRVFSIQ